MIYLMLLVWLTSLVVAPAFAQQRHHEREHPNYSNWVNKQGVGCCNNQDCGEMDDSDVRYVDDHAEVRINGDWCEVRPWMYLQKGNAPNWAANHACIVADAPTRVDHSCSRLLCFQPKPGG